MLVMVEICLTIDNCILSMIDTTATICIYANTYMFF